MYTSGTYFTVINCLKHPPRIHNEREKFRLRKSFLLKNEIVYQEFYEICMICKYKSMTHVLQIWMESQFR